MVWAQRILFAFILLILAGPAFAAIERFSDEKGVIHITNTGGEKPRLEEADEEAPPAPQSSPRESVATPSQEGEEPEPPEAEESPKPSSYLTVRRGVIHITNVVKRQNALARAIPPITPAGSPSPQGMFEPAETALIPAALPGTAIKPVHPGVRPEFAGTPISKYTDDEGVLHISNSPPRRFDDNFMVAGWSSLTSAPKTALAVPAPAESKRPQTVLARLAEPDIAIQKVASTYLEGDDALPMPPIFLLNTSAPESRAAPGVRRFRDANEVLHIVGRGRARAKPLQALPPPTGRAMASPRPPLPSARGLGETYPGRKVYALLPPGRLAPTILMRKNKQGALVIDNAPAGQSLNRDKEEVRGRLEPILREAAWLTGLPVSLIEAVIRVESNFQPAAVSPKGAMGLMQLMPGTARFLRVEDPFCPRENILGGARYLRLLLDFFGQSLPLALAAYNAGFQRVIDAGYQIPAIKETQGFVTQVMGQYYLREKRRYYNRRFIL